MKSTDLITLHSSLHIFHLRSLYEVDVVGVIFGKGLKSKENEKC